MMVRYLQLYVPQHHDLVHAQLRVYHSALMKAQIPFLRLGLEVSAV